MTRNAIPKPPLRWTGVIFAFAATLLFVTAADALAGEGGSTTLATVFAPLLAGMATALYTRARGGLHALIGGLVALPVLAFVVFPGELPLGIFVVLFSTLGATLTELGLRRPTR